MGVENYAIGGSRLFFNNNGHEGAAGDGFLDLGNLINVDMTIGITKLDHFAFIAATLSRAKDLTIVTETTVGLTANFDELGAQQWNIVSSGDGTTTNTQSASSATAEAHNAPVLLDRSIFTIYTNISSLIVTGSGGTPTYVVTDDYILIDAVTGEIQIVDGGAITTGLALELDYSYAARTRQRIKVGADSVLQGSARLEYQAQNGKAMTWIIQNCIVSFEGSLTLGSEGFTEGAMTFDIIADKVVTPAEPYGYRLVNE